jgi:hypothetical protein
MVFNTLSGKREICELASDYITSKLVLTTRLRIIAPKKFSEDMGWL